MSDLLEFRPIQCTQKQFDTLTAMEGALYFTTDTKKIYLGHNNKMLPMCEGVGLFYGTKNIEYDNSGIAPDANVLFTFDEIEGADIPEDNDLILNIDGCFYRISSVDVVERVMQTTRLTLQGTGSGGGGGGGGNAETSYSLQVSSKRNVYSSTADAIPVSFTGYYNGTQENYIREVSFTFKGEEMPFYTRQDAFVFGVEHTIDLIEFKSLLTERKTITMTTVDLYGLERSVYFTAELIALALTQKEDNLFYGDSSNKAYTYVCKLAGGIGGVKDKKIVYEFYTEDNLNVAYYTEENVIATEREGEIQYTFTNLDKKFDHGIYILKVYAQAQITGTTEFLRSNVLTHKFGYFDAANGTPLLMVLTPERTEQYTNIPMDYLLVTSETSKNYTLDIKLNNIPKATLNITSNILDTYTLYFEETGTPRLHCSIPELNVAFETVLDIIEYTGNLPIIDPTLDELMLYLNPKSKSNNAIDRDVWADYNGKYTAQLTGLHYGAHDGWHTAADGASYLQLMSGATLTLPAFKPFAYDPTVKNAAAPHTGSGMTIELDFELNGVLNYNSEIIKCLSLDKNQIIQTGFVITGDKVKFYNSRLNDSLNDKGVSVGALLNLNLIENKRIRLTFVIEPNPQTTNAFPMCYVYLNGILSGAVIYNTNDKYQDSLEGTPATLQINSEFAQVKIYGIRFYSAALNNRTILNNYTASLPTLAERQHEYDTNNVFKADGKIDYAKVTADDYTLEIPYMKITGGWATEEKSKWQLRSQTAAKVGLPTGKKDYRLIDVEVHYPKTDYFNGYKSYSFTNEFASGKTMDKAYGEKPSNGGAIMYAQGTSSMEYPVKNLRLRFKNEENWYKVRPDIAPVEIICMKADYMESSGSHNTGAANFIDDLYTGLGIATPGQEHFGGDANNKIVTCIKGHPCLIFYSESGEPGTYQYIGKYNLNLDKATPEPFGFDHDDSDFGYLGVGEPYYEIDYDADDNYIDTREGEEYKEVAEGEKINSIHCFEFLDNAVEVCNFLGKRQLSEKKNLTAEEFDNNKSGRYFIGVKLEDGKMQYTLAPAEFDPNAKYYINNPKNYADTWYGTYTNADNEEVPGWTLGFESRYPEDRVGYHDADALYPLASWLYELNQLKQEELSAGLKPTDIDITYEYTLATKYETEQSYYIETTPGTWEEVYPTEDEIENNTTIYTREQISSEFAMKSLERFKREYECYLDKKFLLTYYLVTEALLMADSRVKNMMIATWGKEKRSYKALDGTTQETNNYIFYPIFYDMDTMLGLDNTGVYRFNYYDEDTDTSIYNGDEVLWQLVRDALGVELKTMYTELEGAKLQAPTILNYFNANQANMANEAFYNGDAEYKYLRPAREGYRDDLNNKDIDPGKAPYLYAAQGDRSLMREWFLSNRISFLQGKYNSKLYQDNDRVMFRWYYPTGTEADASLIESIKVVPPSGTFNFTSLKTGYAGVKLGANGNVYTARFNDATDQTIFLPEASAANGTEAYLLGLSNLTDLGDLSNKYMQKFIMNSNDIRLETLTLGNAHADYHNPYWTPEVGGASLAIGLSKCAYLKNFNLQNCSAYNNTLDFSDCLAIENIWLTGSSTTGINLPTNGLLKELRLPITITDLKIISHPYLENSKFSLGGYNYGPDRKIGGEGGSYVNNFSRIKSLWIENTKINTYDIVRNAGSLESYYLPDVNWTITESDMQYCMVPGEPGDAVESGLYIYVSQSVGEGEYNPYEGTTYPATGRLYRKVEMLQGNTIKAIPVLDYLLTKAMAKTTVSHAEALQGTITIDIANVSVNELEIYEKYIGLYPNIRIKYSNKVSVDEAPHISFYRYALINDDRDLSKIDFDALEPYYDVLANKVSSLADLSYNVNTFTTPALTSTNTLNYSFTGMWLDYNSKQIYYQDNVYNGELDANSIFRFTKHVPISDMNLFPIFTSSTRYYTITFHDENRDELFTAKREYEQVVDASGESLEPHAYYLYKDDSKLGEHERYTLAGWQSEADFNKQNPTPNQYDFTALKLVNDIHCYPIFVKENAQEKASPAVLFEIDIMGEGTINLKDTYRPLVRGKLTIPADDKAQVIGDFTTTNLTKVYCAPGCKYTSVGKGFGSGGSNNESIGSFNLTTVYLPDTIVRIGNNAFQNCRALLELTLPSKLTSIGQLAFQNCRQWTLETFPDSLETIDYNAFQYCYNVNIATLGGATKGLNAIGSNVFYDACSKVTNLTLNASLINIADAAFIRGYQNVTNIYNYTQYTTEQLIEFGLPSGEHVTYHDNQGG